MQDIRDWLGANGLERYAEIFVSNDIDLAVAPLLDDADLVKLGLSLGHRKRFLQAIAALRAASMQTPPSPAAPGAERRQLTVMFCDLAGATALSTRLDPEALQAVFSAFRRACASAIEQAQGYVAKYLGDGVLAYFGYPHARADAADRAVHAALEAVRAV